MAFKFIAFFACVAVASAGFLAPAARLATIAQPVLTKDAEANDPNPQYSFSYDVQDAISGDNKNQVENRDGDVVHGQYSLNDADGYRRIVDYTADPLNGFNAVVRREPLGVAVKTVAAAPAPVAYAAAPALVKSVATPVAYAAAPALVRSAPTFSYAAPATTLIKTAHPQLAYAAPRLISSAPAISYTATAPALLKSQTLIKSSPVLSYSAAPALVKSYAAAPALTYAAAAPTLVKSYAAAPALHYAAAAPTLLRSQTLIKSAPVVSYSAAPTLLKSYAAAPAVTYAAGTPTIVKTSYASPIVSYAY